MEPRHNESLEKGIEARFLAQVRRRAHMARAQRALPAGVRKALQLATHKRQNVGLRPHTFSENLIKKWSGEKLLRRWPEPQRRGGNFPRNGLIFLSSLALGAGPFARLLPRPLWFAEAILPRWPLPSQTTASRSWEADPLEERRLPPSAHVFVAKQNRRSTKDTLTETALGARAGRTARARTNDARAHLSGSPQSSIVQFQNGAQLNVLQFAESVASPFIALRSSQTAAPAHVRFYDKKASPPIYALPKSLNRTRNFGEAGRDDARLVRAKRTAMTPFTEKPQALTKFERLGLIFKRQSWFDRSRTAKASAERIPRKLASNDKGHARTSGSANLEFPFPRRLPYALRSSTPRKSSRGHEVLRHEEQVLASLANEMTMSTIMIDPVFLTNRVQSYYDAHRARTAMPATFANTHAETEEGLSLGLRRKFPASPVRVHTDAKAGAAAQALHAEAFTFGRDIFFAPGRFDLSTPRGLALMGHELVHVKQHDESPRDFQMKPRNSALHEKLEHEALATEKIVLQNLTKPGKAFKAEPLEYVRPSTISQSAAMKAEEGRNLELGATAAHAESAPIAAAAAAPAMNAELMAQQVYQIILQKLREEKAMRGA